MTNYVHKKRLGFLRKSAAIIPVVSIGGSLLASPRPAQPLDRYQPTFFNAAKWEFVKAATDRLTPVGAEGSGALEANVQVFIDRELKGGYGAVEDWYMEAPFDEGAAPSFDYQLPYTPTELYRRAIAVVDGYCERIWDKPFVGVDAGNSRINDAKDPTGFVNNYSLEGRDTIDSARARACVHAS